MTFLKLYFILLLSSSNKWLWGVILKNDVIMKAIARENAEHLFNHLKLKKSKFYQSKNEIQVQFEFLDDTILVIKYNCKKLTKSYYINKN